MSFKAWRRVPEAGACDFCLMLATRGAVYASDRTAGASKRYHRHCSCHAELETDFDARGDVRISPEDANREIVFRNNGRTYGYDMSSYRNLGVTDAPKVPKSAPVRAKRLEVPWTPDSAVVDRALDRLGMDGQAKKWFVEDHEIISNGVDVVAVPRRTVGGRKPSTARLDPTRVSKADLDSARSEIRYWSGMIDERREYIDKRIEQMRSAGMSPRKLAHLRLGHKVDGYADSEISRHLQAISEYKPRLADARSELDHLEDLATRDVIVPATDLELKAARIAAQDLTDVASKMPSWRRIGTDGSPRGYVIQVDEALGGHYDASQAVACAMRGGDTIWIRTAEVLDRSNYRGGYNMRNGDTPRSLSTLAHEIGHTVDTPKTRAALDDVYDRWKLDKGAEWQATSGYGHTSAVEMYAELFSEWMYGDRANPAVREFARIFRWEEATDDGYWSH